MEKNKHKFKFRKKSAESKNMNKKSFGKEFKSFNKKKNSIKSSKSSNKEEFRIHDKNKFKGKKEKKKNVQYKISNPNFSFIRGKPATKNMTPGFNVYSENIVKKGGIEYRIWDEKKSKLAAAIKKGIINWDIPENSKILYLGIANGTTASHISDMIGEYGLIYGVDFALNPIQNLLCIIKMHNRNNIAPVYDNAKLPRNYAYFVSDVDIIYQDVAQKDQVEILLRNAKIFLKKNGRIMLALKARSVDSTKNPKYVYENTLNELKKHFKILDWKILDPFEKDHCFIIGQKY